MSIVSKKRRVLGLYLDFLLFGAVWATLAWSLRAYVPVLSVWYAMGVAFVLFELAFTLAVGVSPHAVVLGLRKEASNLVVDRRWVERERTWTMTTGVFAILEGTKEATRSLQGLAPPPFMGLDLSTTQATAIVTITGWLSVFTGIGILRCHTRTALAGFMLSAVSATSFLLSLNQMPAWIAARSIARQTARGTAVAPSTLASMQASLPGALALAACAGALCCLLIWRHFRACDQRTVLASR